MNSLRRRSEGGFIPVAFMLLGMFVSAVFAGGLTDALREKRHDDREVRVPDGMVCFADPNHVDYGAGAEIFPK